MASTFGEEGCSANQNARFKSNDHKQQEDDGHFCFVVTPNAEKHYLFIF